MSHSGDYIIREGKKETLYVGPHFRDARLLLQGPELLNKEIKRDFQKVRNCTDFGWRDSQVYIDYNQKQLLYWTYDFVTDLIFGYRLYQKMLEYTWPGWQTRYAVRGILDFRDVLEGPWPGIDQSIKELYEFIQEPRPFGLADWEATDTGYDETYAAAGVSPRQLAADLGFMGAYHGTWITCRRDGRIIHREVGEILIGASPLLAGPEGLMEDILKLEELPWDDGELPGESWTRECYFVDYDAQRVFAWKEHPAWNDSSDPGFAQKFWPGWRFEVHDQGPRYHAELCGLDPELVAAERSEVMRIAREDYGLALKDHGPAGKSLRELLERAMDELYPSPEKPGEGSA